MGDFPFDADARFENHDALDARRLGEFGIGRTNVLRLCRLPDVTADSNRIICPRRRRRLRQGRRRWGRHRCEALPLNGNANVARVDSGASAGAIVKSDVAVAALPRGVPAGTAESGLAPVVKPRDQRVAGQFEDLSREPWRFTSCSTILLACIRRSA